MLKYFISNFVFQQISISLILLSRLEAKHDATSWHRIPSISIHDRSRQRRKTYISRRDAQENASVQ